MIKLVITCAGCGKLYKGSANNKQYRCTVCRNLYKFPNEAKVPAPGMKFCSRCWTAVKDTNNDISCPECGEKISEQYTGKAKRIKDKPADQDHSGMDLPAAPSSTVAAPALARNEVSGLKDRLDREIQNNDQLAREKKQIAQELEASEEKRAKMEHELVVVQSRITESSKREPETVAALAKEKLLNEKHKADLSMAQAELQKLQKTLELLEKQKQELEKKASEPDPSVAELRQKLQSETNARSKLELDLEQAAEELKKKDQESISARRDLEMFQLEFKSFQARKYETEGGLEKAQKENESLLAQIKDLTTAGGAEAKALALQNESLTRERDRLVGEKDALSAERDMLAKEKVASNGLRDDLTQSTQRLQARVAELEGNLKESGQKLEDFKASLDERGVEIGAAVQRLEESKKLVASLRGEKEDWIKRESELKGMSDELKKARDEARALEEKARNAGEQFRKSKLEELNALRDKFDQLKGALEVALRQKDVQFAESTEQQKAAERRMDELKKSLDAEQQKVVQAQRENDEKAKALEAARSEVAEVKSALATKNSVIQSLQKGKEGAQEAALIELTALKDAVANKDVLIQSIQKEKDEVNRRRDELAMQVEALNEKASAQANVKSDNDQEAEEYRKKIDQQVKEIEVLGKQLKEEQALREMVSQVEDQTNKERVHKEREKDKEYKKLGEDNKRLNEQVAAQRKAIQEHESKRREHDARELERVEQLEKVDEDAKNKGPALTESLKKAEERVQELEKQNAELKEKLNRAPTWKPSGEKVGEQGEALEEVRRKRDQAQAQVLLLKARALHVVEPAVKPGAAPSADLEALSKTMVAISEMAAVVRSLAAQAACGKPEEVKGQMATLDDKTADLQTLVDRANRKIARNLASVSENVEESIVPDIPIQSEPIMEFVEEEPENSTLSETAQSADDEEETEEETEEDQEDGGTAISGQVEADEEVEVIEEVEYDASWKEDEDEDADVDVGSERESDPDMTERRPSSVDRKSQIEKKAEPAAKKKKFFSRFFGGKG